MRLDSTTTNMWNQYATTSRLQSKITSQQSVIQKQQAEIKSQQQELQKYETKAQQQQQQIQEQDLLIQKQDSTIQSQNQKLQHEKVKKTSNNVSKISNTTTPDVQPTANSLPNKLDQVASQRKNLRSITDKLTNTILQTQSNSYDGTIMKINQTNIGQRFQQAIHSYQANQILTQLPAQAIMNAPLNLLA